METPQTPQSESPMPPKQTSHLPLAIISVILSGLIFGLLGYWFGADVNSTTPTSTASPTVLASASPVAVASSPPTPDPNAFINITLAVKTLPTDNGSPSKDDSTPTPLAYPTSTTVSVPKSQSSSFGAYGVAGFVVIAPVGWTGRGSIGTDGSGGGYVYPTGGSETTGPSVTVNSNPGCVMCAVGDAAPFFPSGQQWLKDNEIPNLPGAVVAKTFSLITKQLSSYTLPNTKDGLEVNGVFHITMNGDKPTPPSIQEQVTLPATQHDLATTILNDFTTRQNLK